MGGRKPRKYPPGMAPKGKPPGALTVLTREKATELAKRNETPLDVMHKNMMFWHQQSHLLAIKLEAKLVKKNLSKEERAEITGLLRGFLAARENAQRCAVDMAPYMHPRLQSIKLSAEGEEPVELSMKLVPATDGEDRSYRIDEDDANTTAATIIELARTKAG